MERFELTLFLLLTLLLLLLLTSLLLLLLLLLTSLLLASNLAKPCFACVFVFPTTVQRKDVAAVELVEVWWLSKFASYGEISGLIPATYIFFILK